MNPIKAISEWLNNYYSQDELVQIDELKVQLLDKDIKIEELNTTNQLCVQNIQSMQSEIDELIDHNNRLIRANMELVTTEIDLYCEDMFKKIEMPAYKQKRDIKGKYYSIALNELITPNSYEVKTFFKKIDKDNIKAVGDTVSKYLTWDNDNNLDTSGDYYLYPNESIARKLCDCEDHSYVTASANPFKIGTAWGYVKRSDGSKFGHCYNVFIKEKELWILETTGNRGDIHKWEGNDKDNYIIHYIVTQNNAYQVKGGVNFGKIAGW